MNSYFDFPESLIQIIERIVLEETGSTDPKAFIQQFGRTIRQLSDSFNQLKGSPPVETTTRNEGYPAAYIAYFLPGNLLKIGAILLELKRTCPGRFFPEPEDSKTIKVLDLGAGPGTLGIGLLDFFARNPEAPRDRIVDYLAVDRERGPLRSFEKLFDRYQAVVTPSLKNRKIEFRARTELRPIDPKRSLPESSYDLIMVGNLINELIGQGFTTIELSNWIELLIGKLSPSGFLTVIEPALRLTSRNLLKIRDQLAEQRRALVLAPCLHQHACPILGPAGSEKDWCHHDISWKAPDWVQNIDRAIGNRKESLKFSYLVLSKPDQEPVLDPNLWRAVSERIETRGKREVFLCNLKGRIRYYLLDKEVSPLNRAFTEIERGDLLLLKEEPGTGDAKPRVHPDWQAKIFPLEH